VVLERLVQVHGLKNRRIEAGEQLGGDDEDLERIVGIPVPVEELFFLVAVAAYGLKRGSLPLAEMTTSLASGGINLSSAVL